MKLIPYALFLVVFCSACGKHEEAVQSEMDGEVKTYETLSASQTTGLSAAGKSGNTATTPILRAVRTGDQPGMDRIVFEFDQPGLPEWEVKYVKQALLFECGSGDAVTVAGKAWLQITFRGAQAHTDAGEATSGQRRRDLNQTVLRELVRTCDFEGEVTWVAGVVGENEYTTRVLADPSRFVIDIMH